METPFFGPAYISRSTNLADCRCVNLYPEVVETKQGKNVGALYLTPGLTLLTTVGSGPIRGLHVGEQKLGKYLFAMSSNHLFRLDSTFASIDLGTIGSEFVSGPTPMIDNGFQVAVFNGNKASVYNIKSHTLAPITLPFNNQPISASYQDGYGLINQAETALAVEHQRFYNLGWFEFCLGGYIPRWRYSDRSCATRSLSNQAR